MRPFLRRIRRFEGIHRGEDCYIFGDGASVKLYDLSLLCDKPGIAVGCMPRHIDFSKTDVRYWMLPEPMFFWPALRKREYASRKTRRLYQNFYRPQEMVDREIVTFLDVTNFPTGFMRNTYYVFDRFPKNRRFDSVKDNIDLFAGSFNASLSLALYFGFKRAFLIGFDYTHNPPTAGHWYEVGSGIPQDWNSYNDEFIAWISQYLEIVTVVPAPQKTKLQSIEYENLTNGSLQYRENNALLSSDAMDVLDLIEDYRIFKSPRTFPSARPFD